MERGYKESAERTQLTDEEALQIVTAQLEALDKRRKEEIIATTNKRLGLT